MKIINIHIGMNLVLGSMNSIESMGTGSITDAGGKRSVLRRKQMNLGSSYLTMRLK